MKNLKIGTRLGLGFATVLALLVILITITLTRMKEVNDTTNRLVNVTVKNQQKVAEWAKIIELNGVLTEAFYRASDPEYVNRIQELMIAGSARSSELQKQIDAGLTKPASRAQFQHVLAEREPYLASRSALIAAKTAGEPEKAKEIFDVRMARSTATYLASVNKLSEIQQRTQENVIAQVTDAYESARATLIGLGTIAVVLGVGFAVLITRSIVRPIRQAVELADKVSSGDLTSQVSISSTDETGQLMASLQKMNTNLLAIVGQVRTGTDTIAAASTQIAAGNQDLSSRTEQQASSLEETASSMEELTAIVRQNAENSRHANTLAADASDIAAQGGAVVAEVVNTMGAINESSRKIVDIIGVIDSIAFQTNILALNAAVEAARAGEQGRGFAVVATEVRNLAHRSAAAAKEIKGLINDSVHKTETGTALVGKAGSTMGNIVQSIGRVTVIMNEITRATNEQSTGIEQVNKAITEMDGVTQQNAALVEEASAAAEAMQEQAARLAQVVTIFKIGTVAPGMHQSSPIPPKRAATSVAALKALPAAR